MRTHRKPGRIPKSKLDKLRQRSLAMLVLGLLVVPSCVKQPVVHQAGGTNGSDPSASPLSLSGYIRTVLRISAEPEDKRSSLPAGDEDTRLLIMAERMDRDQLAPDDFVVLAEAYRKRGMTAEVLNVYEALARKSPGNYQAHFRLAEIWLEFGDLRVAMLHAEQAITIDASRSEAREIAARASLRLREFDSAINHMFELLRAEPTRPDLLCNIGYSYLCLGDWPLARHYLESAITADPDLAEARNNLGIVLVRLGDDQAALEAFLAANPPAAAYNNLGVVYMGEGRWQEAAAALRESLRLDPTSEKAHVNFARAQSQTPPPSVVYLGLWSVQNQTASVIDVGPGPVNADQPVIASSILERAETTENNGAERAASAPATVPNPSWESDLGPETDTVAEPLVQESKAIAASPAASAIPKETPALIETAALVVPVSDQPLGPRLLDLEVTPKSYEKPKSERSEPTQAPQNLILRSEPDDAAAAQNQEAVPPLEATDSEGIRAEILTAIRPVTIETAPRNAVIVSVDTVEADSLLSARDDKPAFAPKSSRVALVTLVLAVIALGIVLLLIFGTSVGIVIYVALFGIVFSIPVVF
ncbi:MAG: tetratricopeptide repeat protein [Acidobacteria bacterium]|nr:MAG: tetratricopeptide repeat protein [Acidobacteriota bacterium]